jgi:hypothetical protein
MSVDETLSTLSYAQSAHGIINKPTASSMLKVNVDGAMLRPSTAGGNTGNGSSVGLYKLNPVDPWLERAWFQPLHVSSESLVSTSTIKCNVYRYISAQDWSEMECRMQYLEAQAEEAAAALARKHAEQAALVERAERAEGAVNSVRLLTLNAVNP